MVVRAGVTIMQILLYYILYICAYVGQGKEGEREKERMNIFAKNEHLLSLIVKFLLVFTIFFMIF